jgi:hypothetical protein
MAQFVDSNTKTFIAGGALDQHLRVKLSSGKLTAAGVADDWIGTTCQEAFADGDVVDVRLRSASGTSKYIAAGAITTGARVYAAASGKVDDAITTEFIGIALPLNSETSTTAAGANNDICEVLHCPGMSAYRLARGEVTLDGANPTPVTTGLNTIVAAQVTLKSSSAPGDDPSWASVDYTGSDGTLNLYAWKNTGGTDPTLVASTNNTAVFCWTAWGT